MWLALQHESPEDYVFATGEPNSLETVVEKAFKCIGLSWQRYVVQDESLYRPSEIKCIYGDPTKIKNLLGWDPEYRLEDVIEMMVDHRKKSK
jgi:GDPmannose 4,6-dehydratase